MAGRRVGCHTAVVPAVTDRVIDLCGKNADQREAKP